MKYAAKPQYLNPEKPSHVDDYAIWEKIEIDDSIVNMMKSQGWFISDSDNFETLFYKMKMCPLEITPRQARQALFLAGVSVDMLIGGLNSLPSPYKELALIEWEYSTAFKRKNPLVTNVALMLGWTTYQLDDLWILGSTL